MSEANKALVRGSWEMESPEDLDEFYPPDVVWHMPEQDLRGIEEAKQFVSSFLEAFPDVGLAEPTFRPRQSCRATRRAPAR
jgi:SnoaL-like domain